VEAPRASALVDELRAELDAVERSIRTHPFLAAVEAGRAPDAALQAFAGEQSLIIASDRHSFEHLAGRFPELPAGDFFQELIEGESQALSLLDGFAASVGAGQRPYEPKPGCQAYPAFVAWLALNGGRADVALAFLVNLDAWGEACGRMAAALGGRHDVAFFEFFATSPPGFADRALAVVEQGLEAGEPPERARRAARLLQAYELLYWDTLGGPL
jgi:hypothetical protein